MDKFIIRNANLPDLDAIVNLEHKCFKENQITRRSFRRLLQSTSSETIVAEVAKHIIGFIIAVFRKNSSKARVFILCVDKHFRNYGIARVLCERIEKRALKRKCHTITLEVRANNRQAIRFYKALGYEVFGQYPEYFENKIDALRMKKKLIPLRGVYD